MELERWQSLMAHLSFAANEATFDSLVKAYFEKHRHYHTNEHIDHCLDLFDEHREIASNPDEVELALWFHDAIYKPTASDNEAKSAEWVEKFMTENSADATSIVRVSDLIKATVHEAPATWLDARLLVDIDLSILGSAEDKYDQFEADVRREYRWVPAPIFKRERKRILQSFLDRESIYLIPALNRQFENLARCNLTRTIEFL